MSARHVGVGLQYLMHPRVCVRPGHWPLRLVATPTSHICTRTYSTFCLGPMNSCSVCVRVCVCLAGQQPSSWPTSTHKADLSRCLSIAILSKHGLVLLHIILLPLHTHYFPHGTSARALSLARQHSRPDTLPLRTLHDIPMQLSALALCSHVSRCRLCALITICPAQIYTGIVEYRTAYVLLLSVSERHVPLCHSQYPVLHVDHAIISSF